MLRVLMLARRSGLMRGNSLDYMIPHRDIALVRDILCFVQNYIKDVVIIQGY